MLKEFSYVFSFFGKMHNDMFSCCFPLDDTSLFMPEIIFVRNYIHLDGNDKHENVVQKMSK